jgi:hypothetical protein
MTQPLRDTRYARELATAKLPSGPGGKSFVAIERIFVKQTDQVEIRFSGWEGSRMMPRPLDLPEDELLPLMRAALSAGVFSEAFVQSLRSLVTELGGSSEPKVSQESTELERVQAHFHDLIRSRAGDLVRKHSISLPSLVVGVGTDDDPAWFPIEGMHGGFKYWWDAATSGLRLMTESWSDVVVGSGQLHEVTPAGARLLGEGFV